MREYYIAINIFYIFPIMLALCLILSMTHYAQNYADIIGGFLLLGNSAHVDSYVA